LTDPRRITIGAQPSPSRRRGREDLALTKEDIAMKYTKPEVLLLGEAGAAIEWSITKISHVVHDFYLALWTINPAYDLDE
jgi:hypothetical protein